MNLRSSVRSSPPLGLRIRGGGTQYEAVARPSANRFGMLTAADLARDELNRQGALINELLSPSPSEKFKRLTQFTATFYITKATFFKIL